MGFKPNTNNAELLYHLDLPTPQEFSNYNLVNVATRLHNNY